MVKNVFMLVFVALMAACPVACINDPTASEALCTAQETDTSADCGTSTESSTDVEVSTGTEDATDTATAE